MTTSDKEKQYIYNEAKKLNHWIFDSRKKSWYSPVEFLEATRSVEINIQHYTILNPVSGLQAADKMLKTLLEKREILEQRIFKYYGI